MVGIAPRIGYKASPALRGPVAAKWLGIECPELDAVDPADR